MTVIILTACPEGLRGHLTQWLLEISAGVYIGHVSTRIRRRLWNKVIDMAGPGRALLVFQQQGEQKLSFQVHDHHWRPVDYDGVTLIRRPTEKNTFNPALPPNWSKAAKRRLFGRRHGGPPPAADPQSNANSQS